MVLALECNKATCIGYVKVEFATVLYNDAITAKIVWRSST